MKTKAAILVESCKPLEIAEIEIPALAAGQVLVRVELSGICGAQINEIDAVKGVDKFLPHLLGHEAVAEVLETGPGVTQQKVGDKVVMHWKVGAGIHAQPPAYRWGDRKVNAGWVTTFNEMAVISENRLTVMPKGADHGTAPLYGCALTTAFGVINNDAGVKIGESVVIWGTGGVGQPIVLGAHLAGAHPIIAIDRVDEKLELAKRFGATHVLHADRDDVEARLREILPGGADVAIDNVGRSDIIHLAYRVTHGKGRIILVGVTHHEDLITIDSMPLHFGKRITGSFGGDTYPTTDIPRYMRMQMAGRFDLSPLISRRYPFEEINDAIAALREGAVNRVQVVMGGGPP